MKPWNLLFTVAALATLSVALLPGAAGGQETNALAAEANPARQVIESGIDEILSTLRNRELSLGEKAKRSEAAAGERLDFETLSKLAIGDLWRKMTPEQRDEFVREFGRHVLAVCRQATGRHTDQDVQVAGEREEPRGDRTIQTRIMGTSRSDSTWRELAKVDFRLRQRDGQWKVIDVTVGGISMAAGFRAQFLAVEKVGGMERVLQLLREKNRMAEERRKDEH